MERIGERLLKRSDFRQREQSVVQDILTHPDIAVFIQQHQLNQETIERSLTKFNEYRQEREKFLSQSPSYAFKGYEPMLAMNEGYADVIYQETKELLAYQSQQAVQDRINLISLPKSYRQVQLKTLEKTKERLEVVSEIVQFVKNYPHHSKGIYLYGDKGIGKSYIMAALVNELAEKRSAKVTMVHYPTFVVDVKNAINTGTVKSEIDALKTAPVLILDDIGAEHSTAWVRDEVLQIILQYRMLEELPTFFTSNYSLTDLEKKLSQGRTGDETWQTQRVIDRIRAVSKELHLLGQNRR